MRFETKSLPEEKDVTALDGSEVRVLLGLQRGSMAHFQIAPGQVSRAVAHRTVDEIWFVLQGRGEMWRKQGQREESISLEPGVCLTIPAGTRFQFRCLGEAPLQVIGVTMPPWPGEQQAYAVEGIWTPG
jgi:mannose-6-phosphate isomerase-like protein (cupin superfamily)